MDTSCRRLILDNLQRITLPVTGMTFAGCEHKIESKLKLLADYIQQEGMDDKNINYAFVDIGWKGSGLYALNKLQKRFGLRPSICFYWGTLKRCRGDFPIVYNTHVFDKLLRAEIR